LRELYAYEAPQTARQRPPVTLFSRHPIVEEQVVQPTGGERPYLVAKVAVGD
jgi:hypothetical protein